MRNHKIGHLPMNDCVIRVYDEYRACTYNGMGDIGSDLALTITCNCKKGSDWLKRCVEHQQTIYIVKCFLIGQ